MHMRRRSVQAGLEARAKVVLAGLKGCWSVLGLMAVLVLSGGVEALQINPTFVSGSGESWDSTRIGVINQAIADWELSILDEQTVDVSFTFSRVSLAWPLVAVWGKAWEYSQKTRKCNRECWSSQTCPNTKRFARRDMGAGRWANWCSCSSSLPEGRANRILRRR